MGTTNDSMAIWRAVTSGRPTEQAWRNFHEHYSGFVYRWALKRLARQFAAEEVTNDVFSLLVRRITKTGLAPIEPNPAGSFRPYITMVVNNVCTDYRRSERRRARLGLTIPDIDRLDDPASIDDLCDQMANQEEEDERLARLRGIYAAAFRDLKAAPQFEPRSLAAFLRVYHDGRKHTEVDAEFGQKLGWSSHTAGRVRVRLIDRMVLRDGRGDAARFEFDPILDALVRTYGDPSV